MSAPISEAKRKKIIADYVELGSYKAVARRHNCSDATVRKYVLADKDTLAICAQKNEMDTQSLLQYMDSKKGKIQAFFDIFSDNISNKELVDKLNLKEQATVFGIIWDKACNPATNININKDTGIEIKLPDNIKDYAE